jgi:hypothetical protein
MPVLHEVDDDNKSLSGNLGKGGAIRENNRKRREYHGENASVGSGTLILHSWVMAQARRMAPITGNRFHPLREGIIHLENENRSFLIEPLPNRVLDTATVTLSRTQLQQMSYLS